MIYEPSIASDYNEELILDNFRLFHTPGPFYSLPFKIRSIPSTTKGETDV